MIRNRSAIMARHLHAHVGEAEVRARLGAALSPLQIDATPADAMMEGPRQFAMGAARVGQEAAADSRSGWVHDFARGQRGVAGAGLAGAGPTSSSWAHDFARMSLNGDGARGGMQQTRQAPPTMVQGQQQRHHHQRPQEWAEEYSGVKESSGAAAVVAAAAAATAPKDGSWAGEFVSGGEGGPSAYGAKWAEEYNRQLPGGEWASEFSQEQETAAREAQGAQQPRTEIQAETAEHSARLAETLAANPDPKFQNSQFLQFMSRMSRGEIVVEGNGVKEVSPQPATVTERGGMWAGEFAGEQARGGGWADEFAAAGGPAADWAAQFGAKLRQQQEQQQSPGAGVSGWAGEFAAAQQGADPTQNWANEFADIPEEWAREFEEMQRGNPDWAYENVWDQVSSEGAALRAAERSQYQFTDPNPYLGRSDALEIGRDLFRRGVLSEAALALEAAVRADTQLCEGWRLLGTVHAENDDDRRAISAMTKANEADPTNLEVLLSLGVSHTNELDQEEATGHMRAWLRNQPRFAALEAEYAAGPHPLDTPESVLELFTRAAAAAPRDADVHAVLGVLAHLSRDYDRAISAFNTALEINPQDYSLWNKLGATQANSARSPEAMGAYQRALDLKPNYVRAWCNMGIGFANQGKYEESVAYYVRALSLNPQAESAWGYLRISLGCCGRIELMEAVDNKDLETLQKHFPL